MKIEPNITVKDEYILVELREVDYWQIWDTIGQIHNSPESYDKNEIWVFSKGPVKLTDVAMHKLKDFIKEVYPKDVNTSKTAIVVDEGEQSAMVSFFSQIAEDVPFEIKVFSDFQAAEGWIIKERHDQIQNR